MDKIETWGYIIFRRLHIETGALFPRDLCMDIAREIHCCSCATWPCFSCDMTTCAETIEEMPND